MLRKLYEECIVEDSESVAIFKIPMVSDLGFSAFLQELITDKAELVEEKSTTKFKDIMPSNREYLIMKCKKLKK